jgi:mannose-6-phosphate isomerase-like protein (cupin superfamily)
MLYQMMKYKFLLLASFLFVGCTTHHSKVVLENKGYQNVQWTEEEKQKEIAIRHMSRTEYSSTHLLRVRGAEKPHVHDHHDLTVTVISGKSIIHFKDHEVVLEKGDVVHIPRGTYHWAENIDPEASVAFAVFSPAYKGKDKRLVK